jgi:hypothetical protein
MITFFGAAGDVRAGLRLGGEQAGALEHDVDVVVLPRNLGRVAHGVDLDALAVDDDVAAFRGNLARELAVRGVVLGQVRVGGGIAEVVDRDHFEFAGAAGLVDRAQHVATDAAVAVDRDLDRHGFCSWEGKMPKEPLF